MKKCHGQALTEFAISLPVLSLLMVWGITHIQAALQEKVQAQQLAGLALGHADERNTFDLELLDSDYWNTSLQLEINSSKRVQVEAHADYPFAVATRPFEVLARYAAGLEMSNQNLWALDIAEQDQLVWMRYQRLRDDWSPRRTEQLAARPRVLTGTALLDNQLVRAIQSVLGATPMGRELRPKELVFGHVDADVVPARALCSQTGMTNCGYD